MATNVNGAVAEVAVEELQQVDTVALAQGAKEGKKLRAKGKERERKYTVEMAKRVLITTTLGSRRGGGGDMLRKALGMALRKDTFGDFDSKKTITKYALTAEFVKLHLKAENVSAAFDVLQGGADNEDKVKALAMARAWFKAAGVKALFAAIDVLVNTGTNVNYGGIAMQADRAVALGLGRAITASECAKAAGY